MRVGTAGRYIREEVKEANRRNGRLIFRFTTYCCYNYYYYYECS